MDQLKVTEDGSYSLLDEESGELFHNRAGAYSEARCNYIEPSRIASNIDKQFYWTILDVCFGLGYNSFALFNELEGLTISRPISLEILAIEKDPALIAYLPRILDQACFDQSRKFFNLSIESQTIVYKSAKLRGRISIRLADLRSILGAQAGAFDMVFHDPFSAKRAPELWSVDLFSHYHRLLQAKSGQVLTYSAATAVRSALRLSGFNLYRTAALGAKTGGTLASLKVLDLSVEPDLKNLSFEEEAKLAGRSRVPYRDPGLSSSRREVLNRRMLEISSLA